METMNPQTLSPPVMNLYSQIAIAPAGRLAFVAGQVAVNADGELIGAGDHGAQAKQALTNIRLAMEAVGAEPSDIVQMKLYVVDHDPSLIEPIMAGAGKAVFGSDWPLCASTYIGVEKLGLPDWLIEIDAVICVPEQP